MCACGLRVCQAAAEAAGLIMPARAVARIFHGLSSPQYPAYIWGRNPYWAKHKAADFQTVLEMATRAVETGALARPRVEIPEMTKQAAPATAAA